MQDEVLSACLLLGILYNYTATTEGKRRYIVMKRSLYRLINNLRASYWALIIRNNKCPIIIFSCLTARLRLSFKLKCEPEFELIKTYSIKLQQLQHLASGVLLLMCECNIALTLYHNECSVINIMLFDAMMFK